MVSKKNIFVAGFMALGVVMLYMPMNTFAPAREPRANVVLPIRNFVSPQCPGGRCPTPAQSYSRGYTYSPVIVYENVVPPTYSAPPAPVVRKVVKPAAKPVAKAAPVQKAAPTGTRKCKEANCPCLDCPNKAVKAAEPVKSEVVACDCDKTGNCVCGDNCACDNCPKHTVKQEVVVPVERVSGPTWTWPGDLSTHLRTTHGVSTDGLSGAELVELHDNLHNSAQQVFSQPLPSCQQVLTYGVRSVGRGVSYYSRPRLFTGRLFRGGFFARLFGRGRF